MNSFVQEVVEKALDGGNISQEEALRLSSPGTPIMDLIYGANAIRTKYFGNKVKLCAVVNAKGGICSEDCSFCAQSARWNTGAKRFGWIGEEEVVEAAKRSGEMGASMFGVVTSGSCIESDGEFNAILGAVERVRQGGIIDACASLGMLDETQAHRLKEKDLRRYHHNLETSRDFFPNICSTHTFEEMVSTVKVAKGAGLEVCSGGIFGLGEGWADRVNLAFTLRDLGVGSVPINFLIPIVGTPLASRPIIAPMEALRIVALFRFILPDREIRVCGGREECLGDLQSWIFHAGANGTMIGDYLTREGRSPADDLKMIRDLGMELIS